MRDMFSIWSSRVDCDDDNNNYNCYFFLLLLLLLLVLLQAKFDMNLFRTGHVYSGICWSIPQPVKHCNSQAIVRWQVHQVCRR